MLHRSNRDIGNEDPEVADLSGDGEAAADGQDDGARDGGDLGHAAHALAETHVVEEE